MAKKLVELDQQHHYQLLDLIEEKDENALDNELDKHDDLQNDHSSTQETSDKASRGISLASSEKVQVPGVPFQSPTKLRFAFVDFNFTFLVHTMLTAMQNLDHM